MRNAHRLRPARRRLAPVLAACAALVLLAGCGAEEQAADSAPRPVGVARVEAGTLANALTLTGEVQAQNDVNAGFRIGGRLIERPINIGDQVKAGQLLARLERTTEENALRAAKAAVVAGRGEVETARNTFERQQRLMDQGFTTRPRFDQARQALETAQAALEDAEARAETAQDRLGFTELHADAAGIVTARGAEPGEVVQPGQMIVRLARDDGRDAVFDVPSTLLHGQVGDRPIRIVLSGEPGVTALGRVREVSSQADPVTRTFRVRVGLDAPPAAMRLGSTVTGSVDLSSDVVISIPASALTASADSPAVWIVDLQKNTVSLRNVDILRFEPDRVVVAQGLEPGETIVTSGIQALYPGRRVAPLPERVAALAKP